MVMLNIGEEVLIRFVSKRRVLRGGDEWRGDGKGIWEESEKSEGGGSRERRKWRLGDLGVKG